MDVQILLVIGWKCKVNGILISHVCRAATTICKHRSSMHWKKSIRAHCGTQTAAYIAFMPHQLKIWSYAALCCWNSESGEISNKELGWETAHCPCRFQILCLIENTHQPSLLCTNASYAQLTAKFSTIAPDCTAAQTQFKSKVKCQLCLLKFPKCENWIIDPQVIFSFLQGVKGVALDKQTCNSHVWTGLCTVQSP